MLRYIRVTGNSELFCSRRALVSEKGKTDCGSVFGMPTRGDSHGRLRGVLSPLTAIHRLAIGFLLVEIDMLHIVTRCSGN